MRKNVAALLFVSLCVSISLFAQKDSSTYTVAFYNIENLYDPNGTDELRDKEFSPMGSKKWTQDKYEKKLNNLAYTINKLGKAHTTKASIIGVAEVGNRKVLEDLVKTGDLAGSGYEIVHYDSPDRRGVDVGFLYDPKVFTVTSSHPYPYVLKDNPDFKTRDQLLVSGVLAGEPFHVIVNHWPSRYGEKSSELREYAASITKHIADSLYKSNKNAKIVIMGDMNDDPTDKSCRLVLDAKKYQKEVKEGGLFNTMWELYDSGIGSLCYRGKWNLFDQIIISESLLGKTSSLSFWKAEVFNADFLIQKEGNFKGYPLRTFSGNTFLNGYSDHFPTLIYLKK